MKESEEKFFVYPEMIKVEKNSYSRTYGKFYAEPLERGFGTTIGNSFRRVLLSSIKGAAPVAVRIEGVNHEFTSIPGVVEDVTDIILNIKQIRLIYSGDGEKEMRLNISGKGEVLAGDFEHDDAIKIVNPDLHIATLEEGGKLNITLKVRKGVGFVPAERNKSNELPLDFIPIDSIFSPVRKALFRVENIMYAGRADYERLILEIWTDGTITPEGALREARDILVSHFDVFKNIESMEEPELDAFELQRIQKVKKLRKYLLKPVSELEVSVRVANCFKGAGIKQIKDLVVKTEAELIKTPNFGRKSLAEIRDLLFTMGLRLGMTQEEVDIILKEGEKYKD